MPPTPSEDSARLPLGTSGRRRPLPRTPERRLSILGARRGPSSSPQAAPKLRGFIRLRPPGHSLGGALATLVAPDLAAGVDTSRGFKARADDSWFAQIASALSSAGEQADLAALAARLRQPPNPPTSPIAAASRTTTRSHPAPSPPSATPPAPPPPPTAGPSPAPLRPASLRRCRASPTCAYTPSARRASATPTSPRTSRTSSPGAPAREKERPPRAGPRRPMLTVLPAPATVRPPCRHLRRHRPAPCAAVEQARGLPRRQRRGHRRAPAAPRQLGRRGARLRALRPHGTHRRGRGRGGAAGWKRPLPCTTTAPHLSSWTI